jgi:hypothetical protein
MMTSILIGLLSIAVAAQADTEQSPTTEVSPSEPTAASVPAPDEPPASTSEPKKPRRGKAPTADRISGVDYVSNPDGTMRKEVTVAGERVEHLSDPVPTKQETPSDPSYQPPKHATVGSIHDSSTAHSATGDSPEPNGTAEGKSDGLLLLLAIAGGLVLVGLVAGLISRASKSAK